VVAVDREEPLTQDVDERLHGVLATLGGRSFGAGRSKEDVTAIALA
jgi:hypothetical protein